MRRLHSIAALLAPLMAFRPIRRSCLALLCLAAIPFLFSGMPPAHAAASPDVDEILAAVREAPAWDWLVEIDTDDSSGTMTWKLVSRYQGKPVAAIQAMRIALTDDEVLVRRAALGVLTLLWQKDVRFPEIVDLMLDGLRDPSAAVFGTAVYGLNKIGKSAEALPIVLDRMGDPDPAVRWRAVHALRPPKQRSEAAFQAVLGGAGDADLEVRQAAIFVLGDPWAYADRAVPVLTDALADPAERVRSNAVQSLGRLKARSAGSVPQLIDRLHNDEDKNVRMRVATSLGYIGTATDSVAETIIQALIVALEDPSESVRNNAAHGLLGFGPAAAAAIPALTALVADDSFTKSSGAAGHALGKIGPAAAAAVPVLIEALGSETHNPRWGAINGLRGIGPDAVAQAIPHLVVMLDEGDSGRQRAALHALREFAPPSGEALAAVTRLVNDEDKPTEIRLVGISTLAKLGHAAIPFLREVYETWEEPFRLQARNALKMMRVL